MKSEKYSFSYFGKCLLNNRNSQLFINVYGKDYTFSILNAFQAFSYIIENYRVECVYLEIKFVEVDVLIFNW